MKWSLFYTQNRYGNKFSEGQNLVLSNKVHKLNLSILARLVILALSVLIGGLVSMQGIILGMIAGIFLMHVFLFVEIQFLTPLYKKKFPRFSWK